MEFIVAGAHCCGLIFEVSVVAETIVTMFIFARSIVEGPPLRDPSLRDPMLRSALLRSTFLWSP
jgi:hypothetical protein